MASSSAWDPARFAHRWFARVADLVARLGGEHAWPSVERLNDVFGSELSAVGMRLVESAKTRPALRGDGNLDPSSLYEVRIVERGEIPTRPCNAHDLLNALVWAGFPRAKLALAHALAAVQRERAADRARLPATRTPAHDRLALVDEGGIVRVDTTTWIFGHAIYEHAYAGRFDVRGTAIALEVPGLGALAPVAARAAVDRALAAADLARAVRAGPGIAIE